MIFKTITDETTLSGQRIVGALQARKIAQQQATAQLEIDIACLKEYRVACQNGTVTTEQFDTIMHKASASAVEYSAKIKAGTGTAQSYANAQRATNSALQEVSIGAGIASKAVKLFSTALNMIAFTAIIQGINWLIGRVDDWIVTAKEAKESANALKESLSTFFSETQSNFKTISSLSDRFDELSKNVDDNGKKIGGTEEEYAEFLDICQQVGQIMPELITGYTAEGEAIITLQGKVDSLTDSYKEAIKAKAALFISNGDEEGNTINSFFKDYNDFVNGYQGFLGLKTAPASIQTKSEDFEEYYGYDKIHEWLSYVKDATFEELSNLNSGGSPWGVYIARVLKEANYDISNITEENYNAVHDVLNNKLTVLEKELFDRVLNIKSAFQNMLYADSDYWNIDDENVISAINSLYSSIDAEFIKENQLFNQKALQTFESNFISLFNNDDTKQAMVDFYTPIANEETVQEYTDRINSALQKIQSYCENNGIVIPIEVNDSINTLVNNVKEKLQDEFDDKVGKLTLDELQIAAEQIKVSEDTLLSWDELIAKIKQYKEGLKEQNSVPALSLSETINQLNVQLKPAMDSLASAWNDIFTDDDFALNSIDIIATCDSIKSKLDELNEIEGITVDYSAYEHFIDVLNSSDSEIDDVKQSFNDLAFSITQAGLSGAEDFDTLKAALEDLGVVNEELVAFDALISNTDALKEAGLDLANATDEEIAAFANEIISAENLIQAIDMLTFTKLASNTANMDTSTEVANLRTLAENAGYTGDVIKYLTELEQIYQGVTSGTIPSADIPGKLERAKELTALIQESAGSIKYEPQIDFSSAKKAAGKAGKEAGKSYVDGLKDELSNLNDVIGAIGDIINNQIDLYNDQKDAAIEALEAEKEAAEEALEAEKALVQEKIDAKQDEIDKIKEAAEARKNEIDLQQKQYELARLENQRTLLVYSEDKGMHYVQDTKEIRNAKEAVTEAQENIKIAGLEKEISGLEDVIDSLDKKIEESNKYYDDLIEQTEKYWDSLIKGLEDYKSRWEELAEIEEQAKVLELLKQMGISTNDVLNMSESAFQGFKESYLGLLGEMYKGNDQMIDSLSRVAGVDMSSLNGYLAATKDSIDDLKNTDLSSLSDSFDNVTASAGNTSSAINGSGGTTSKASGSGSGSQTSGSSSGSGDSLKSAIKDQTEAAIEDLTTQKDLFSGDEGLKGAVQEVIDKIGSTDSESGGSGSDGSEGEADTLVTALKQQTEEALNEETGIPAQKRAWEELNQPLGEAVDNLTTIKSTLEDLDGKTFTVTLSVVGGGSLLSGDINAVYGSASSADHSHGGGGKARFEGTAHIEGTANAKGNWGTKKSGKSLVGELGQELIVFPNGTFRTVGDHGAEFVDIPKGSIVFNHLQTEQLLDKGNIVGRGKPNTDGAAYANGTASAKSVNTTDGVIITADGHVLRPIQPGDRAWELQKAFEPLLKKIDGNLEYLAGNAMIEYNKQMEKMISQINTTNVVNNRNIQPNVTIGDIHVTCPGVTSQQVAEQLGNALDVELNKKFSGFHNLADQYSRIR